MATAYLFGLNRFEGNLHEIWCRYNASSVEKGKLIPLFKDEGGNLVPKFTPNMQKFKAVMVPSAPPSPNEITPNILSNVIQHLDQVPPNSPCAGHTFYFDTKTAELIFCKKDQVPNMVYIVDLLGQKNKIPRYYLDLTADPQGVSIGRARIMALLKGALDSIAANTKARVAAAPAPIPTPVFVQAPPSGPTYTGSFPVVSSGRGSVGGPWGAQPDQP